MLTNPTLNQMQALGLAGMAAAWGYLPNRIAPANSVATSGSA